MEAVSKRRNYFIDPAFQLNFIFKICAVIVLSFGVIGIAAFFFPWDQTSDVLFSPMMILFIAVAVCSAIAVIFLTLFASHKIVGPIFRIRKEIEFVQNGDLRRDFSIRSGDQMQELAGCLQEMTRALRKKHLEIGGQCRSVTNFLEEKNFSSCPEDRKKLLQMLKELYGMLGYFKV